MLAIRGIGLQIWRSEMLIGGDPQKGGAGTGLAGGQFPPNMACIRQTCPLKILGLGGQNFGGEAPKIRRRRRRFRKFWTNFQNFDNEKCIFHWLFEKFSPPAGFLFIFKFIMLWSSLGISFNYSSCILRSIPCSFIAFFIHMPFLHWFSSVILHLLPAMIKIIYCIFPQLQLCYLNIKFL